MTRQGSETRKAAVSAGHGFNVCWCDQKSACNVSRSRAACEMRYKNTTKTVGDQNCAGVFGEFGFERVHPVG
ncbi:hypothetical protein D9M68_951380 [compost metagenome]